MKDLKLLVKDYPTIAKNALTILVNISEDAEVLKSLADDGEFLENLLKRVTVCQWPLSDLTGSTKLTGCVGRKGAQRQPYVHGPRQPCKGRLYN